MALIRRFEEEAGRQYQRAKAGGFLHLAIGEEATIVGTTSVMADRRLPDRHLPHPRPRDRPRHRPQARDGGALRPRRRDLAAGAAARCTSSTASGGSWAATGSSAATCRSPPGLALASDYKGDRRRHRLHVRRRRLEHRQLRRDDEPGGALAAAGRLHPREQPLRDGHLGRAPLGGHRLLEEGRGPGRPGRARRRHGRAGDARDGRRAHPDRPRGAPADDGRGVHLPLPRPLRRRPRGLPDQGGGRGVAQEGPDRGLRRPARGRGRARRATTATEMRERIDAAGAGGGRVRRRLARAAARHPLRPPLRGRRPGARLVRGRRARAASRSRASASARSSTGEAKRLAEAGAAYGGQAASTPGARDGDRPRRPRGRRRARGPRGARRGRGRGDEDDERRRRTEAS